MVSGQVQAINKRANKSKWWRILSNEIAIYFIMAAKHIAYVTTHTMQWWWSTFIQRFQAAIVLNFVVCFSPFNMIKHFGKLYGKDLLTFKWNDELFLDSWREAKRVNEAKKTTR